jgi:hypothetical protein
VQIPIYTAGILSIYSVCSIYFSSYSSSCVSASCLSISSFSLSSPNSHSLVATLVFLDSHRLFVCFFRRRFLIGLLFLFLGIFSLIGFLGFSGLLGNDNRKGIDDWDFGFFYTILYIYLFRIAVIGLDKI